MTIYNGFIVFLIKLKTKREEQIIMDGNNSNLPKKENYLNLTNLIISISLILVVYLLYTKLTYPPQPFTDRGLLMIFAGTILFALVFPQYKGIWKTIPIIALICVIVGSLWVMYSADRLAENFYWAGEYDFYFFAVYFIGVMILLQYNLGGKIVSALSLIAVVYVFVGRYFTGTFSLPVFSPQSVATMVYTDVTKGAFGTFLSLTSRILSLFLMFSALLVATGLGDLIKSVSMLAAGKAKGGPAKVAVISSALFGMMSGSAVSNVAATGSFTIPLMKSIGYKPTTAAAIETIASCGGGLAPPIMGLSAFIMSEMIGVPYFQIIVWAIIPAALWYYTTFLYVHYSSYSQDVQAWEPNKEELIKLFKDKAHLLLAILTLVITLVVTRVAELAALYSLISLFILSTLRKSTRLDFKKTKDFLLEFGKLFSTICVLNTMLGIFVGALLSTGMHFKVINLVYFDVTNWVVVLFITFILCIIFGMLVPPFAAYVTVVLVASPLLTGLGFETPVVHMFVLICCVLAPITPPVAVAAYTAATIADTDAIQTAKEASFKALPLWIFPFIVFRHKVMIGLTDNWYDLVFWLAVMMIGIFIFSLAVNKYCFGRISNKVMYLLIVITIFIMQPVSAWVSTFGVLMGIAALLVIYKNQKNIVPNIN